MLATVLRYWLGGLAVALVGWVVLCHLARWRARRRLGVQ